MMPLDMVKEGHLGGYIRGGDPGTWCPHLWTWAVRALDVRSVLDVGCGEGHATRFFRSLGCDSLGIDGSEQAIAGSVVRERVVQHDMCQRPFVADRRFDLVWSCEFLEHVEARYVPNILRTFDAARRLIMVTHAFPNQTDGHHHVNCRPSRYWIQQIESLGFECDVRLTREARRATLADYQGINHFARSGLVFVRRSSKLGSGRSAAAARQTGALAAWWKGARIAAGFKLSSDYRQQKRRRRAAKRLAKSTLAGPHRSSQSD